MVLWIFGYGSLIWTPDFHYEERVSGYVKDYRRSFVQIGTADDKTETVGLNLTLEPEDGEVTGGVAYRVSAHVEEQILSSGLSNLDSSNALMLDFFTAESDKPKVSGVLTYIVPPQSSNLWYIVSNMMPVVAPNATRQTIDGSERVWKNEPRVSPRGRRVSRRDRCRDLVCFESGKCCIRH